MKKLKVLILCSFFVFSACNSNSRSSNGPNAQIRKIDPVKGCVAEEDLLAGNIIGGQLVGQNDEDAKVVLMVISGNMLCTGAAIRKNVILTAAHCIAGDAETTSISFYTSRSCESGFDKRKHTQAVEHIFVHEDYNENAPADKMKGDIAIIVLKKDIPEGYIIHNIVNPDKIVSDDIWFYGYGRINSEGESRAGVGMLRKTSLPMSLVTILSSVDKVQIDQSQGTGICKGDSGGPSFVEVSVNGTIERQILGVNSYVSGPTTSVCSDKSFETLAFPYLQWIDTKLNPF